MVASTSEETTVPSSQSKVPANPLRSTTYVGDAGLLSFYTTEISNPAKPKIKRAKTSGKCPGERARMSLTLYNIPQTTGCPTFPIPAQTKKGNPSLSEEVIQKVAP